MVYKLIFFIVFAVIFTHAVSIRSYPEPIADEPLEEINHKALRVSEIKCQEYISPVLSDKQPPQMSSPLADEVYYITGGERAGLGEFPHMAAIGWEQSDRSYKYDCGGALISLRFVLTAAHCTYSHGADNPVPRVVVLGDQNIDSSVVDGASPVQIPIKTIHKHPRYTRKKRYDDIALLELFSDVSVTDHIQPTCLWSGEISENKSAIAIGWGVSNPNTNEKSNDLQKVFLTIQNNQFCNKLLVNSINRKWDRGCIDTQLCAGEPEGGKDTCQGDSGAPLQIISNKYPFNYYVIGVTSFGPSVCARLPAIYTKVSRYLDWIEGVVWPEEYKNWTALSGENH